MGDGGSCLSGEQANAAVDRGHAPAGFRSGYRCLAPWSLPKLVVHESLDSKTGARRPDRAQKVRQDYLRAQAFFAHRRRHADDADTHHGSFSLSRSPRRVLAGEQGSGRGFRPPRLILPKRKDWPILIDVSHPFPTQFRGLEWNDQPGDVASFLGWRNGWRFPRAVLRPARMSASRCLQPRCLPGPRTTGRPLTRGASASMPHPGGCARPTA